MKWYEFPCGCRWPVVEDNPPPDVVPFLDLDTELAPEDCPATWAMLSDGHTKGVFQLESPLGRQWTKKLKPGSYEHMSALGALLRPGCLRAVDEDGVSMTQHYVRRRHGQEDVKPYHPAIDAILHPTYGVLAYQEQAMAICVAVAAFTEQEADMLRKAIGKKLPEEMAKCKKMFMEGAAKAGLITAEQAVEVFGWIEASQRYSFNKSHSACYGVTGYRAAYIKAHHPVAFFTAWLRNAKHKQDPQQEIFELVNDARIFDITVEPPDLLSLEAGFHTDRRVVKFGLADIKGIGEAQIGKLRDAIAPAQAAVGRPLPEWTWYEFLTRFSDTVTSSVVLRLIQVGALRWMRHPRCEMEAEFRVWDALTDKEREWVRTTGPYADFLTAMRALSNPKRDKKPPTIRLPKKGREQEVARLEVEHDRLVRLRDELVAYDPEEGESVTDQQAFEGYEEAIKVNRKALTAATRPAPDPAYVPYEGPEGGCSSEARRQVVLSHVELLANPRSARVDSPLEIAYQEEQLLGISISCSRVDSCDTSQVNCSCKEFLAGRTGFLMLGVEVQEVREFKTKSGKNPGSKYGRLTVSDGTCALEAVAWPEVWKEYSHLLNVQGNMLIVQGERDFKDKESTTLIIKKAFLATQAGNPPG